LRKPGVATNVLTTGVRAQSDSAGQSAMNAHLVANARHSADRSAKSVLMVSGPARNDTAGRSAMNADLEANGLHSVDPSGAIDRSFRAAHRKIVVTGARSPPEKAGTVPTVGRCAIGRAALVQRGREIVASRTSSIAIRR